MSWETILILNIISICLAVLLIIILIRRQGRLRVESDGFHKKISSLNAEIKHLQRVIADKEQTLRRFIHTFKNEDDPDEERVLISIKKFEKR